MLEVCSVAAIVVFLRPGLKLPRTDWASKWSYPMKEVSKYVRISQTSHHTCATVTLSLWIMSNVFN